MDQRPEMDRTGPRRLVARAATLWRTDGQLRRRLADVAHLLVGNYSGALIALLAVALTARALGPTLYGMLALTIAFARAIERIVSFQSWQPIIKYAAALDAPDRADEFRTLIKFGLLLDIGAAFAGWLIAVGAAMLGGSWLGWNQETIHLVLIYSTVLLFNITGVSTAILRLSGRFRTVAYGQVLGATVRLILCAIAVRAGAGLLEFAFIWMGTQILSALVFLATSMRQLKRQGIHGIIKAPLKGVTDKFPGLWNFAITANLSLTLRSSAFQLDVLLVGALAGPTAAGLYHIVKQVGRLALQVGQQVQAVVYPDVAKLWVAQQLSEFRRAILQVEVMLASFGILTFLAFLFLSEPLLRLTAGPAFTAAAPLLIIQMFAVLLSLCGAGANSALLAMGRQRDTLRVVLVATVAFHATALLLIPRIGAMGANVAHVVLGAIWLAGLALHFRRALRNHHADAGRRPEVESPEA